MPNVPMTAGVVELDAQEVAQDLSLEVRIRSTKWYDLRMWIGLGLMRLGMWIIGVECEVNQDGVEPLPDILYAGWVDAALVDLPKWREMCASGYGPMATWSIDSKIIQHIHVTPQTMQRILDEKLTDYPHAFTAYWRKTDKQLPVKRQLWGGAPVQLC